MKVSPTPGHNAVQAAQSREQVQENKKVLPVPSTAPATELRWFHNVMAVSVRMMCFPHPMSWHTNTR